MEYSIDGKVKIVDYSCESIHLLPTGSVGREVLGVGNIPGAMLSLKTFAFDGTNINKVG